MDDTETDPEAGEDLADAAADLADTLEALRAELREPPRGPLGLPRPPSPGELLALTERYTIPALVSTLETSIRLLELLAAAIRLAQGRSVDPDTEARLSASEFAVSGSREGVDRLAAASRTTLERLDDALADLQAATTDGTPRNPEAERLLEQARQLRAEVDDRLAEIESAERPEAETAERTAIDVDSEAETEDTDEPARGTAATEEADETAADAVDIDAELASLKEDVDADDDGEETHNDT
ncbi:DUF7547 family protein [Natronomonas amylolytica]|uniref:DUF7547 family protein n=1 Tax=Natronomonas amylolytica TaxID=3108498 RepID=UPI00300996A7